MKKIFLIIIIIVTSLLPKNSIAQGTGCGTASPFCTASGAATFPASQNTVAPVGPNYGCLGSEPNPAWFYLQIATSGPLQLTMSNSANVDIDFVCWGPFTSASAGCTSGLTSANVAACSYSINGTEVGNLTPNPIAGQVYILLITNYSNQPTTISLAQTSGSAATNCTIVCAMDSLTVVPGVCHSPDNLFDVSGTIKYKHPPTSGTLTISNSCSGADTIINAPFDTVSASYTLHGLPANGAACTVTAKFSTDPNCSLTKSFTAPPPCFFVCPIHVDSARVCEGLPATLTATGATSYLWSTGATTASITVSSVDSTYTVIGTTGTCKDTAISKVRNFPPPTAGFLADKLNGCDTLTVNFKANTAGNAGASYSWNFGDGANGSDSTTSHFYDTHGCHTVSLKASLGPGCSTTKTDSCLINVFALPTADFSVSPAEIEIIAPTADFLNTSINSTNYLWNFGDSTGSSVQNPDHTYPNVGIYKVTLYASSANGCLDSTISFVTIKDIITCYIPNTFTPNKNGRNDTFNIYSYGMSSENFELLIFNRWGKQIFKTNDSHEGWNGAINNAGEVCETAIYVYHLNYQELSGKKRNIIGLISLIK